MHMSQQLHPSSATLRAPSGRYIELGGEASYHFRLTAPLDLAYEYFCDIPAVLRMLPDTLEVRAYAHDRFRLLVGASDGHGHSMAAVFDLAVRLAPGEAIWLEPVSDGPPLRQNGSTFGGALWAEAIFQPNRLGTDVAYSVAIEMHIPIPGVLRLMPQSFLQSLGEKTMAVKMSQMIDGLARGVHHDFDVWAAQA
jgi:hypothetical protein